MVPVRDWRVLLAAAAVCPLLIVGATPPAAGVAAPVTGPWFKGATTNAHLGINSLPGSRPAAAAAGDLLLAVVAANQANGEVITPPNGWRRECWQHHPISQNLVVALFSKIATSSDPPSWTWSFPSNSGATVAVTAYGGADPNVRLESCEGAYVSNTAAITAPATTTATANSKVLAAFAFRGAGTSTPPSGTTERFDVATASDAARSVSSSLVDQLRASVAPVPAASATASLTAASGVGLRFALPPAPGTTLFSDSFTQPNGPIATESLDTSPDWIATSGSLFAHEGRAWTGEPDWAGATNSAVFRVITRRPDFENARVSFTLWNWGLLPTKAVAWDGVHVFLRYQSPYALYYASINRRDNKVVIKKKVPGGPSNGGDYDPISPTVSYAVPYGQPQAFVVTIRDAEDGTVRITLSVGGRLLVEGVDDGSIAGPPYRGPGHTGIRGDNANFEFDDFSVVHLG